MKKLISYALVLVVFFSSCRKIQEDVIIYNNGGGGNDTTQENTILEGKISADRILKSNYVYKIRGIVYVVNNAKLTIEAGTRIEGEKGATSRGTLVITKGSQLIADATSSNPIVFTSDQPTPQRGDWGGIVILGNAKTNASYNGVAGVGSVEGGVNNAEGLGLYGGTNDADNSGVLRYVRIEYAGYAYLPDNELNGLTLAGVGNSTVVDFVEVFKANDDAIECFGGTVNIKHAIFISTLDDDFDTDNGWSGKVQFGIVVRDSAVADISKSEGFESDNDANGSTLLPQTTGVYSNITVIGPRQNLNNIGSSLFLAGGLIRRNSTISIFNSVIMGFPTGLIIDGSKGTPTDNNIRANTLFVQNTLIAGCAIPLSYSANAVPTGWTSDSVSTWFLTPEFGNGVVTTNDEVLLTAPYNYSNPDFTPQAGSPLLTGASFTHPKLATGFTPVTYRGAVGPAGTADADWWKGWSKLSLI